jgi:hypothetical protein
MQNLHRSTPVCRLGPYVNDDRSYRVDRNAGPMPKLCDVRKPDNRIVEIDIHNIALAFRMRQRIVLCRLGYKWKRAGKISHVSIDLTDGRREILPPVLVSRVHFDVSTVRRDVPRNDKGFAGCCSRVGTGKI